MQRLAHTVLILAVCLPTVAACAFCVLDLRSGGTRAEQNAVYTDFLNAMLRENDHDYAPGARLCPLAIMGHTVLSRYRVPDSELPAVPIAMRRELDLLSLQQIPLGKDLAISGSYRLLTDKERAHLESDFATERCADFMTFTRIVFNPTGQPPSSTRST